jgi:hypothetical protein
MAGRRDGPWVGSFQNCVRQPRPPFKMTAVTKIEISSIVHCCLYSGFFCEFFSACLSRLGILWDNSTHCHVAAVKIWVHFGLYFSSNGQLKKFFFSVTAAILNGGPSMSSLTYIRGFTVKFFFQPIYTNYANWAYFDKRSHFNLLLWNRYYNNNVLFYSLPCSRS